MLALANDQHVARQVLLQHVPGLFAGVLQAADAQALALADGVVHEAVVAADHLAVGGLDVAGLGRQVLLEEITETALADEADAGGILLLGGGQAVLFGDGTHLRLLQLAHRKQAAGDLLAAHGVQEVALVLVGVQALEQFAAPVHIAAAHVMAGGDQVGAQHQGIVQERLELDFPVAEDVGVRGTPGLVFGQEVLEHVVPVLGGEVGGVQVDAQPVAHGLGVRQVFPRGAVLGAVVLFPVLHEQAFDLVALLLQEQGGNGGVHPSGHADNDAFAVHGKTFQKISERG